MVGDDSPRPSARFIVDELLHIGKCEVREAFWPSPDNASKPEVAAGGAADTRNRKHIRPRDCGWETRYSLGSLPLLVYLQLQ